VGDTFDGSEVTAVWVDDRILVEYPDGSTDVITGVTFYTADGRAVFTPTDDTILQDAVFLDSRYVTTSTEIDVGEFGPPCFLAGTLIRTRRGMVPVEAIEPGDRVWSLDHGWATVRWRGGRAVNGLGDCAPIRFAAGVLGNERPLLVSPQHRMLITGWRAELLYGEPEVLIAAKHLIDGAEICRRPMPRAEYHHILFDGHEIIEAEGVLSESFHPGDYVLSEDAELRAEILAIFPELATAEGSSGRLTARHVVNGTESKALNFHGNIAA